MPARGASILEREQQRLQKLSEQVSLVDSMLRELRLLHEIERNPTEIDLNVLVSSLAQNFRCDLFFKHHVQLELRLANDLPLVRVLARHLIPALIHLFRNAVTALREAPEKHLTIESRREGESIWLLVAGFGLRFPSGRGRPLLRAILFRLARDDPLPGNPPWDRPLSGIHVSRSLRHKGETAEARARDRRYVGDSGPVPRGFEAVGEQSAGT